MGKGSLEDEDRSGPSATATTEENIAHMHRVMMDDRRLTVNQIYRKYSLHLPGAGRDHSAQLIRNVEGFRKMDAAA